ncbi:lipid-A-disaccharide synthase N-terminal domain-containing protein [Lacinutrix sp. C3R15]|uniref:lipid-A-disaccharide synthase N-terminal domain-containing protein n=1 Tax=Flavobacteriaceae TaxID=49546 RepID=UPI001C09CD94|nr:MULTISPECIES: lipid-A-disaccharide synthase N-terminal domain-containing protein [Flavobacteriaceae]MBU2939528.1 lipid-A-disaccharide synthase N-terminal domain-containing protein [Lacinutrix sp. C3R15]MDO6622843.1 lipid-A-disaccharide synthase N-terminal domain-containing protein [Oceanihabitans sp. 1_MG-2023]
MSNWLVYSIGFAAQILFSSRLIIQWITSEKQKKVITPTLFWTLSLFASFLLFVYGYLRDDFAIMLGQGLTYFIYIRNLQLQNQWQKFPKVFRWFLLFVPVFISIFYFNNNTIDVERLFKNEAIPFWLLLLGIVSQIVFTLRFVFQWLYSEKQKESSLPFGFWLLSLIGSSLILIYAIIRKDPVLFIGHVLGAIIYSRNLILLKKDHVKNT